jgi:eukaryotic-like serine/threonine-protein kinase
MNRSDSMTPARWELVTRIFEAALEEPPSTRNDFVRETCKADADLEAEVNKLLTADERAASFLESPPVSIPLQGSSLNSTCPLLSTGSVVSSRFEIVRFIGQGGMGQVYEAVDLELKSRVALKVIRPDIAADSRILSRFRREVLLTRRITHPNVCRTFDIERHLSGSDGVNNDLVFLTMELLEGETLADLLRRQGRLTTAAARPLVLQMIEALRAAHEVGVVHRDFKPSNVLLVPLNSRLRVVVTDFGLARSVAQDAPFSAEPAATSLTGGQGLIGTLIYMAPEQLERGDTSVASDIYALGLVMYEMVTGNRPFADPIPFVEAVKRLKQAAPSPKTMVPELDSAWEELIRRSLELEPARRFGSLREIQEALQESGAATSISREAVGPPSRQGSRPGTLELAAHKKILMWVIAAVILVSLSVGLFRFINWRAESSRLPAGSKILLTDLHNESHDPELDGATELLRSQLSQSAYTNLLEPDQVAEELERMSQPKSAVLEPKLARDLAWRKGVPLVIFGTISRVAEDYRLDLKAERIGSDPSYPKKSWIFSETAANKRDFFEVVHHGGTWLRHLVGEEADQVENSDRRPEDVTTSSWEALKLYSDGQRSASLDRLDEAVLLFKRAAEKDPEFAMAWMRLGDTLDTIGKSSEGFAYWRRALAVSGDRRLSPREELRIKGMYASDTGDLKAAVDYFSQYSLIYPNDYLGFFYRGVPLMLLGRTEEAIQVLQEAETRAPDSYYIADHLARYNLILGNFSEVARYTKRVRELKHPWWAEEVDGQASVMSGDYEGARKVFDRLANADDPFLHSARFYLAASVLAEQGRYDKAIEALHDGVKADLRAGDASDRADKLLGLAYLYWRKRDLVASREAALQSVEAEPSIRRTADAGSLLGRAGFTADAQHLLNSLDPQDTATESRVARLRLRGEILLAKKRCQQALDELQEAKALDQEPARLRDYWGHGLFVCGRHEEAEAEFARLISRPGQVWHQPENYMPGTNADLLFEYGRAGLQLAKPEARVSLEQYIKLRSVSDPGLLEPIEARAMLNRAVH